jgi:hypothetical protein
VSGVSFKGANIYRIIDDIYKQLKCFELFDSPDTLACRQAGKWSF